MFLRKFVRTIWIVVCFIFGVGISVKSSIDQLNYSPKDIMKNGNTTIEGGRYSYDSFKIQNRLFNGVSYDDEKIVFLTFDDGPSLDNTPQVLDILKEYNIRATFFVLGANLNKGVEYEEILKRVLNEGHAIANHGYSHNYSYLYPGRVINYNNLIADMDKSHSIMKDILGDEFETRVLRLPGGLRSWKNQNQNLERLNSAGYSVIEWNALNGDADGGVIKSPDVLVQNAIMTANSSDFVVLLMHDFAGKAGYATVQALPRIIDYFKENGYQFRTMY